MNTIKLQIKLLYILLKDFFRLNFFKFPKKDISNMKFGYEMKLELEIKPGVTFENKVFNLKLAAKRISEYIIMPGELFSFWKVVGSPNKDFKNSRSIVNGKLQQERGGGLCQVSGIVYYAGILAGLQIIERHNHSMDIYREDERFTPLGTDATVVYGNKDLRFRNNLTSPIKLKIEVDKHILRLKLLSNMPLKPNILNFDIQDSDQLRKVRVTDQNKNIINTSIYQNTQTV